LGEFLQNSLGISLVFSFEGLVAATFLFSLPFLVNPVKTGFESLPEYFAEVSEILGKSRWSVFWKVQLPNLKPSLITGACMGFAHSMGAFGFILMIGGNIPGKTRVASVAIYNSLERMDYQGAHLNAFILVILSLLILSMVHFLKKKVWEV
jgi:molybdate transport system permease protein